MAGAGPAPPSRLALAATGPAPAGNPQGVAGGWGTVVNDAQEQPQLEQWAWVPPDKVATQRFPGERELRLKVCLLGEPSVGKTSLIRRFVHDLFDDAYVETLGAKVSTKELRVRHRPSSVAFHLLLQLWDIAGQHRVDFVTPEHY